MNTAFEKVSSEGPVEPSRLLKDYRHGQFSGHDQTLADPGCKHCYGTGNPGRIRIASNQPQVGKLKDEDMTRLTCACVIRAEAIQEYLKEIEEWQKTQKTAEK